MDTMSDHFTPCYMHGVMTSHTHLMNIITKLFIRCCECDVDELNSYGHLASTHVACLEAYVHSFVWSNIQEDNNYTGDCTMFAIG